MRSVALLVFIHSFPLLLKLKTVSDSVPQMKNTQFTDLKEVPGADYLPSFIFLEDCFWHFSLCKG